MTEDAVADPKAMLRKMVSSIWWVVLLRGLALLVLGALLMYQPLLTAAVLIQFLGFYWLIEGVFTVIESIRGRASLPHWGRGIFVGLILIAAALLILSRPMLSGIISQVIQVYLVAALAFLSGISSILTGIRLRKEIDNEWSMILGGVLSILLAILLVSSPLMSAVVLLWIAGISCTVLGILLIYAAFRIRRIVQ